MAGMKYFSTRGGAENVTSSQAVLYGLAPDGGLYVPSDFPSIDMEYIVNMTGAPYPARAASILKKFFTDYDGTALERMCGAAYSRFEGGRAADIVKVAPGTFIMELFRGPTLAFKDLALTLLPHLMTEAARIDGEKCEILILVATSGDTGKAALSGFQDVPGTSCAVFYPDGGVSEAQRLQMITQSGDNTHVIAVTGNFDDTQTGVKRIFGDPAIRDDFARQGYRLSSANSINFGRLAPQIVYYFSAYADLISRGEIAPGDKVNFCVPTGNFGNILAAEYARRMGLPVGRLICASNMNNILTDFINTGVYDIKREFHLTSSPSMDILISSNLERMLFEICGRDSGRVADLMRSLGGEGRYEISEDELRQLNESMYGGWASEEEVREEIRRCYREDGYLLDPHTAVAMSVYRKYRDETGDVDTPCVLTATASPFKFGRSVAGAILDGASGDDFALCRMISDKTGLPVPAQIAELPTLPVRHSAKCSPDDMARTLADSIYR